MTSEPCARWVMWKNPNKLQLAWVLHRRPYQDTGLILELFTSQHGRVGAVARGGRKQQLLQPFQPLWVELAGQSDLLRLQQCEAASSPIPLAKQQLYCGMYLNELLVRLLYRHDKQPILLAAYADALEAISNNTGTMDVVLRRFELLLLEELGYAVDLSNDANDYPLQPASYYVWKEGQGWLLAAQGWLGGHLLAMGQEQWTPEARRTARNIMRMILAPHLGAKPLQSRSLFQTHPAVGDNQEG